MFNWFDLVRQTQTSAGFETLARQFQISEEQAQKAMVAFMPAFAMGLQHAMLAAPSNPLLQTLAGQAYQTFWQTAGQAFSAQAQQSGKQFLDQLFGSDEASRRVAHQAADFTGMSIDLMQQMLPLLAGILAGSLHQWMMNQGPKPEIFTLPEQKPKQKRKEREKEGVAAADPWTAFWTGWMQAAPSEQKTQTPHEDRPQSLPPATARLSSPPSEKEASPPWEEMMEKGHEMQMQYFKSLQSILNDAWRTGETKR